MIAPPTLAFPAVSHRTVNASFDGGDLTSDTGLLFLAQADQRLGLTDRMARVLLERRQIGKIRFDLATLLKERIRRTLRHLVLSAATGLCHRGQRRPASDGRSASLRLRTQHQGCPLDGSQGGENIA